jgi:molybdate-binding protein/transcriptional regulator with XRE-family HTH domain
MILSIEDRIMSDTKTNPGLLLVRRAARKWSQAELARRAGISRTAVSAIEGRRLTPSVTAALSLAAALECSVEELFGRSEGATPHEPEWAWTPRTEACRYWEAEVSGRRWLYPVEAVSLNPVPHDGVWEGGVCRESSPAAADRTLSLTCCDPAAGLLAAEYARTTNFRLLIFPRNGRAALDLVRRGLVHVAGLHRSTAERPGGNAETVRAALGGNHRLLRAAQWEEGVALPAHDRTRSAESVARHPRRWAARETGSAARECLDELLGGRRFSGREVDGHPAVAEAVRAGWAEAGVCVRFSAAEAGLNFLPMRKEALDFCFAAALQHDPRIQALIRLLRSRGYRRLVSELPGYDARQTGEMTTV